MVLPVQKGGKRNFTLVGRDQAQKIPFDCLLGASGVVFEWNCLFDKISVALTDALSGTCLILAYIHRCLHLGKIDIGVRFDEAICAL